MKTWNDLLVRPSTFGGEGAGSDPNIFALLYRNVFGAKIKLVHGYPGTSEITLATERGEVDGLCGLSWSTLKGPLSAMARRAQGQHPGAGRDQERGGAAQRAGGDRSGKEPEQRQILNLILIGQAMARPFAAPPGIPADRKAALIAAFDRTMQGSGVSRRGGSGSTSRSIR